jgi:hypothetical protein
LRSGETERECAQRFLDEGRCPFPLLTVPGIGEVGADYSAECKCGKRVKVHPRGLFAHHKPARKVLRSEIR